MRRWKERDEAVFSTGLSQQSDVGVLRPSTYLLVGLEYQLVRAIYLQLTALGGYLCVFFPDLYQRASRFKHLTQNSHGLRSLIATHEALTAEVACHVRV